MAKFAIASILWIVISFFLMQWVTQAQTGLTRAVGGHADIMDAMIGDLSKLKGDAELPPPPSSPRKKMNEQPDAKEPRTCDNKTSTDPNPQQTPPTLDIPSDLLGPDGKLKLPSQDTKFPGLNPFRLKSLKNVREQLVSSNDTLRKRIRLVWLILTLTPILIAGGFVIYQPATEDASTSDEGAAAGTDPDPQ